MSDWLIIGVIVLVLMVIIGNLSILQKNAKTPLRKKSLNELKETIPRSNKTEHKLPTIKQKNSD